MEILVIRKSIITGCHSLVDGKAIYVGIYSKFYLKGKINIKDFRRGNGQTVFASENRLVELLENYIISSCNTHGNGGAIYSLGKIELGNSSINNCKVVHWGAIYIKKVI